MNVLLLLIPVSLMLGLIGLGFCIWAVRTDQYRDPEGDARRILDPRYDAAPKPPADEPNPPPEK
jgi:cbb3-type cytochrome oxidase maturation protein